MSPYGVSRSARVVERDDDDVPRGPGMASRTPQNSAGNSRRTRRRNRHHDDT